MRKLLLSLLILVIMAIMITDAHAYRIRTVIKSNGVPYTWTSKY